MRHLVAGEERVDDVDGFGQCAEGPSWCEAHRAEDHAAACAETGHDPSGRELLERCQGGGRRHRVPAERVGDAGYEGDSFSRGGDRGEDHVDVSVDALVGDEQRRGSRLLGGNGQLDQLADRPDPVHPQTPVARGNSGRRGRVAHESIGSLTS